MSSSSLGEIYRIASELTVYSARYPTEARVLVDHVHVLPPLNLEPRHPDHLRAKLNGFAIEPECVIAIVNIFKTAQSHLLQAFSHQYDDSASDLRKHGADETFLNEFRRSITTQFSRGTLLLEKSVLDMVATTTSLTKQHANNTYLSMDPDFASANQDNCARRGHDTDAVRILEQAFNHSPNITQAEKFQLAEVTGLKPKQVTIWFQNRRNRKGKKAPKQDPTHTPPHHTFTPSSPPTRDFTLSEKKRKSYGALGHTPSEYTDSDSDSPSSHLKKPRLPRASSGISDASSSSIDYSAPFTAWSSPSSRSTSSSSASSSPSDCFDSPTKVHNVFKYINPLKYDVRSKTAMPSVTIATPPLGFPQGMASDERSPFTSDHSNNSSGTFGRMHPQSGLNFGNLQLNTEVLDRELRESIQRALELSASSQCSSRNVSSSSWGSQQMTTDDDGWVDEDDFSAASAGRQNTPVTGGAVVSQPSLPLPAFQAINNNIHTQSATQPLSITSPDTSLEASIDTDTFDLNQFFESATIPASMPSSSPFVPHTHHSPQPPFIASSTTPPTSAAEMGGTCFDLECEMTDIQEYLNSNFITPSSSSSLLSSQQSMTDAGSGQGQGQIEAGQAEGEVLTAAQFALNFDLSSNMFSLL